MVASGGASSGVARGEIRLDYNSVLQSRQVLVREFRAMSQAGQQFSRDLSASTRQVNGALNQTAQSAQATSSVLNSVFAGTFLAGGVRAAQHLRQIDTMFNILSGSQEKVNENMAALRRLSEQTGQPMLRLKESANALLPAIARSNAELDKTLSVAQRLAILDPAQGAAGAAFALREFLSGEYISLTRRFELDRGRLQSIRDQAGGDTNALIEGLSRYIDEIGLTNDKLREMNEAGVTAFENAKVAALEAAGQAFTPLLTNFITPALQGFIRLNQEAPQFVQALVGIGASIAAITLINTGLQQTQALLAGIRGIQGRGALIGGLGIAATAGVPLGLSAARFLADRGIGDPRLRSDSGEDPGAVIGERLKQVVVIVAAAFIEGAKLIDQGGFLVENAITQLARIIRVGALLVENVFLEMVELAQGLLLQDTSAVRERRLANAQTGLADLQALRQGFALTPEQQQRQAQLNAGYDQLLQTLTGFLFPAVQQQAQASQAATTPLQQLANALQANQAAIAETAQKVREVTDEFEAEKQRIAEERGISAGREQFDFDLGRGRALADFQTQQARSNADFYGNLARQAEQFRAQQQTAEAQAYADRMRKLADFAREQQRAAEDHGRRLAEIERDTRDRVQEAAARLDARGAFFALRDGRRRISDEEQRYAIERQRRQEDFNLQLAQLQEAQQQQAEARAAAFAQQQAEQIAQYQLQQQRQVEDFNLRLAREDEDRALRLARQQEDYARQDAMRLEAYNREIAQLRNKLLQETGLGQQFVSVVGQTLGNIRQSFQGFLGGVQQDVNALRTGGSAGLGGGGGGSAGLGGYRPGGSAGLGYAFGGMPQLNRRVGINERGLESGLLSNGRFAVFTNPATIFPANQTRQILSGGGGGGMQIGTFAPVLNIGDIGSYTPEQIEQIAVGGMKKAMMEAMGRPA